MSKILQYQEEVKKAFDDKFPRSLFVIDDKMDDFVKVEYEVKNFLTSALQGQLKILGEEIGDITYPPNSQREMLVIEQIQSLLQNK